MRVVVISENSHFKILESIPFPKVNVVPLQLFMEDITKES